MEDDSHMPHTVRTISLSDELWEKIRDYQHGNRHLSRIDAIREMLELAHAVWVTNTKPMP